MTGKPPDMAREVVKVSRAAFGNGILPLLFPKERVPASYSPNRTPAEAGTTWSTRSAKRRAFRDPNPALGRRSAETRARAAAASRASPADAH
jgi:hypothetical protein